MSIVAHDLGTSGCKASLHDDAGRLLGSATVPYLVSYGPAGEAEQDPEDWARAAATATRQLLETTGHPADEVDGVVLSGHMQGMVLLDAALDPVRPAMIWADRRSTAQAEQVGRAIDPAEVYRRTGHRLSESYTLSKALWVAEEEPDLLARAAHLVQAKDFVVARLTGTAVTDPSDASGTNVFLLEERRWWTELAEAVGLPPRLLPDVVPSTTVVGPLTSEAAGATGLRAGTPVVMGGGDGPIASVAAGSLDAADDPYVCLGSSAWLALAAPRPALDPARRTMTFCHVVPERYVPIATMQSAGTALDWIAGAVGGDLSGGDVPLLTGGGVARLLDEAAGVRAAEDGLFFLPHLLGERAPLWTPNARGAFVGLTPRHGRAHLVRAVVEGVAHNLRDCRDALVAAGARIERVQAVGGGARSALWLQILADVLGVPVLRRSLDATANSLGAAVTGLVGLGAQPDFAVVRTLTEVTATFEPERDPATGEDLHVRFEDARDALLPWFEAGAAGPAAVATSHLTERGA